MAVEVTKPGVLPAPVKLAGTCVRCGCEVRCDECDATETLVGLRALMKSMTVPCPTPGCGEKITVDFPYNRTTRR